MSTILLIREFDQGIDRKGVKAMAMSSGECFGLYNIDWKESFLSDGGRRMVCHFEAPDAEAVRTALSVNQQTYESVCPATEHLGPDNGDGNVLVERYFDSPTTVETLQALEDKGAWCLEAHGVVFVRTLFSRDQKKMFCLYRAADAESVRLAQRQAGMPVTRVWSYDHLTPAQLFAV
jgi:hypothetical protein